jgi:hypothetical protein
LGWQPEGPAAGLDGLTAVFVDIVAFYRQDADLRAAITQAAAYDSKVAEVWGSELNPKPEDSRG